MTRTSLGRKGPNQAGRYYTPPWTDVPAVEPELDTLSFSAAGGMCSTLTDLAPGAPSSRTRSEVLADTLEEMCQPIVTADPGWVQAWGLGFILMRHEDRLWVGHTGAHPGTISGVFTHRESATTGVVLMNQTGASAPATFAATVAGRVVDDLPPEPEPWGPGESVPPELEPLLGQWFSEGVEFVFGVRQGRLEAQVRRAPAGTPSSVFEPDGPDASARCRGASAASASASAATPRARWSR